MFALSISLYSYLLTPSLCPRGGLGRRNAPSGETLALAALTLARADDSRPFDATANACVLSRDELRTRARLTASASKIETHAATLAAMQTSIDERTKNAAAAAAPAPAAAPAAAPEGGAALISEPI